MQIFPTVTTLSPSGTEATLSSYHSTFILAQWLVLLSTLIGLDTARETSLKWSFTLLLWGDLLPLGQVMAGWEELPSYDGPSSPGAGDGWMAGRNSPARMDLLPLGQRMFGVVRMNSPGKMDLLPLGQRSMVGIDSLAQADLHCLGSMGN